MQDLRPILVATFYKFVPLDNIVDLQTKLLQKLLKNQIKGTVLLAEEGINSTISGQKENVYDFLSFLRNDRRFENIDYKESFTNFSPFRKTKVKLKSEIVALRSSAKPNPNKQFGEYVLAHNWNQLIQDPDVLLIDVRNSFEYKLGTFKGAIDPKTEKFSEMIEFTEDLIQHQKPKEVAMFCTGGIRCEKYSSFILSKGIEKVYQLKGGILKYLEDVPYERSLWEGDCFVFDDRVKVNHKDFE